MRDFIQILLDFLVAEGSIVGDPQKDIILDEPDRATAIYETTPVPTPAIARSQVRSFQVVCRSSYDQSFNDSWNCHDSLDADDGSGIITIDGSDYKFVLGTPFKLKKDEQQRTYFAFNLNVSVPK